MAPASSPSPDWLAAALGAIGALVAALLGWMGIRTRSRAEAAIAEAQSEPAVLAATSAAMTALIESYRKTLEDLRAEVSDLRDEIGDLNSHIDRLTEVLREHNIAPPVRRHRAKKECPCPGEKARI